MLPQTILNLEAISRGLVSLLILHFRLLGICVCSIDSSKLVNNDVKRAQKTANN